MGKKSSLGWKPLGGLEAPPPGGAGGSRAKPPKSSGEQAGSLSRTSQKPDKISSEPARDTSPAPKKVTLPTPEEMQRDADRNAAKSRELEREAARGPAEPKPSRIKDRELEARDLDEEQEIVDDDADDDDKEADDKNDDDGDDGKSDDDEDDKKDDDESDDEDDDENDDDEDETDKDDDEDEADKDDDDDKEDDDDEEGVVTTDREPSRRKGRKGAGLKGEDESSGKKGKKEDSKSWAVGLARDIGISVAFVVLILGGLFAYSGIWPPMVVIESSSMMHGTDSQIGVIDTGDLCLVKKIGDRHDVVTYVEATCSTNSRNGYKTYGDFGDVIVYKKNGQTETPVIHRALVWVEYNSTSSNPPLNIFRGDVPDAGVYNAASFTMANIGYQKQTVTVHFDKIFRAVSTATVPHGGFLTKGDHNPVSPDGSGVDQEVLYTIDRHAVEPIRVEWVVGKAEGELPWFGLFKLWVSGHPTSTFPPSSVDCLILTVVILVVVPLMADYSYSRWKKTRETRKDIRKRLRESKVK